jgi:acetyltransferase-like isoleucine patch superfamily enzyme
LGTEVSRKHSSWWQGKTRPFARATGLLLELAINCDRAVVILLAKTFGIQFAISYLRNPNSEVSAALLRRFAARVGANTTLKRSILLDNVYEDENSSGSFSHLSIGTNCYIGDEVYFDLSNRILIEDHAIISARVSFVTHADCHRSKFLSERFPRRCAPVKVGGGAWIGFGATILHGVTIGESAVVGAGSVVRTDVPAREMWVGTPAKFIRHLE